MLSGGGGGGLRLMEQSLGEPLIIKSYNGFTGLLDKVKKSLCQHS